MAKSKYVTFEDLVRFHREVVVPDLDARFGKIDERFEKIDQRFVDVDRRFESVALDLGRLNDRIDTVEQKAEERHLQVLENFDGVYQRLDELSIEYQACKGGLKRLEERVTKLETTRS